MNSLAIIADDLTGAADAGVQFCEVLSPVNLLGMDRLAGLASEPAVGVLSVFTSSRGLCAKESARKTDAAARELFARRPASVYKKIDSSLRGNIGAEIDAIMHACGLKVGFVCPAFPEQGRTTVDDIHYRHDVPVAMTELRHDPVAPVTESRLSMVVASQSSHKVGRVGLSLLDGSMAEARAEIESLISQGCRHIVFDATASKHLDRVVALAADRSGDILLVGSAGLARSLAGSLAKRPLPQEKHLQRHPVLWVCGSASERLAEQAALLRDGTHCASCCIPADMLIQGEQKGRLLDLINSAADTLGSGQDLLLQIGEPEADAPALPAASLLSGFTEFVVRIVRQNRPQTLFLSGGDTAESILGALEVVMIRLREEAVPGIVTGMIVGGIMDGHEVMTKAGSFGEPGALLDMFKHGTETGQ